VNWSIQRTGTNLNIDQNNSPLSLNWEGFLALPCFHMQVQEEQSRVAAKRKKKLFKLQLDETPDTT